MGHGGTVEGFQCSQSDGREVDETLDMEMGYVFYGVHSSAFIPVFYFLFFTIAPFFLFLCFFCHLIASLMMTVVG